MTDHDHPHTIKHDGHTYDIRASVHHNDGQQWATRCRDHITGQLARRPARHPGQPNGLTRFMFDHRDCDTEIGTATTAEWVERLYARL